MLPADLKGLYEAYTEVYEKVDSITDDIIEEVVEELIEECVLFGYEIDEAADAVEQAAIEYLMELNPYAPAGSKEARAYQKSTTATKRGEARKAAVTAAKEKVKAKAKGAVAAAGIAASIAKDEARRAGRAVSHAVSHTVQKKKAEVKSGVKSLIGKGLRKAAGAVGKVASKAAGAAAKLGESSINEEPSLGAIKSAMATQRSAQNAAGMRGPELTHGAKPASKGTPKAAGSATSGSIVTQPRSREFSHGTRPLKNVVKGGLTMSYNPEGEQLHEKPGDGYIGPTPIPNPIRLAKDAVDATNRASQKRVDAVNSVLPGSASMPKNVTYFNKGPSDASKKYLGLKDSYSPEDIYDVILEYLMSDGHAETLEEAHYVMSQLTPEHIQSIIEAGPLLPGEPGKAPSSGYKEPVLPGEKRLTPELKKPTPGSAKVPPA